MSDSTSLGDSRIPQLDGIRGLAILLVLIWHFAVISIQATPGSGLAYAIKVFSLTWGGVDLFFVLSGFLIGGILLNHRTAPRYFIAFYARRVCRIFPPYYLLLALFIAAYFWSARTEITAWAWLVDGPMPLWSYFLFVQNFAMAAAGGHGANWLGVTWSLAIEEQFYLLLPLLIRFLTPDRIPYALSLLIISAPVFRTYLWFYHPLAGFPGFVLLPGRWDSLLIGVLVAFYVRNRNARIWLDKNAIFLWGTFCVLLIGVIGFTLTSQGIGSLGMSVFGHTWLALLGANLILIALFARSPSCNWALTQPMLLWLGSISYGVYLYHQFIHGLCHLLITGKSPRIMGIEDGFVSLLALALTLGIATISLRYFERPILRLGQRISYA